MRRRPVFPRLFVLLRFVEWQSSVWRELATPGEYTVRRVHFERVNGISVADNVAEAADCIFDIVAGFLSTTLQRRTFVSDFLG